MVRLYPTYTATAVCMADSTAVTAASPPEAHAHHPPHLHHHFVSSNQQFDAAKMGMWLFLITEVLLFSGMFVAYTVYRVWHPEVFDNASELLDWRLGGLNTLVLLASSFTVALSIHFAQKNEKEKVVVLLLLTLLCASGGDAAGHTRPLRFPSGRRCLRPLPHRRRRRRRHGGRNRAPDAGRGVTLLKFDGRRDVPWYVSTQRTPQPQFVWLIRPL